MNGEATAGIGELSNESSDTARLAGWPGLFAGRRRGSGELANGSESTGIARRFGDARRIAGELMSHGAPRGLPGGRFFGGACSRELETSIGSRALRLRGTARPTRSGGRDAQLGAGIDGRGGELVRRRFRPGSAAAKGSKPSSLRSKSSERDTRSVSAGRFGAPLPPSRFEVAGRCCAGGKAERGGLEETRSITSGAMVQDQPVAAVDCRLR